MKNEFDHLKTLTADVEKHFGPTTCLAKWYHANIYFQTGETHSCYHPAPHLIDLKSLQEDPAHLHNTPIKKQERQLMLDGERPKGCQYCWNIEDLGSHLISDRHIRTGSIHSEERISELKRVGAKGNVVPNYMEISFSNLCNFKCGYCHPKASSRYFNEIQQHGPYLKVINHHCNINELKIYDEETNPYLDAWWKWWPTLKKDLKTLRITGGEPLIQKSTFRLLDMLQVEPMPNLELNINSNLGSNPAIIEKFCLQIEDLKKEKKIRFFKLFTSIDTWGQQAEYLRTGLSLKTFENNLKQYMQLTTSPVTLMITFNLFSLFSFADLLKKILEWRAQFNVSGSSSLQRLRFDISYLKEPLQYDINILPKDEFLPYVQNSLDFMREHLDDSQNDQFSYMEYQKLLRISEYMDSTQYQEAKILEGRKDFFHFFSEMDRRRNSQILTTFPELTKFWKICEASAC